METSKLSELYFIACNRFHEVIDDLYEALHEETGVPIRELEGVEEAMEGVRAAVYQELDLIKSAVSEYEDLKSKA
jgi:hypothetical protein